MALTHAPYKPQPRPLPAIHTCARTGDNTPVDLIVVFRPDLGVLEVSGAVQKVPFAATLIGRRLSIEPLVFHAAITDGWLVEPGELSVRDRVFVTPDAVHELARTLHLTH